MNISIISSLATLLALCQNPSVTPLEDRFDPKSQPFAFLIPKLAPVAAVGGIKASDCALCHRTIYDEWRESTHANALTDIQFQAELAKVDSPRWLCLNCHTPLVNQRSSLVQGLIEGDILRPSSLPNPDFEPELQLEAVTCAVCHIRSDSTGQSYIIGPTGSKNAPHPLRKDPDSLKQICQRCHNPKGESITPNLVCWFKTYDELDQSGIGKDCASCHLPAVERVIADAYPEFGTRTGHRHTWVGSGIPKWISGFDSMAERHYVPGVDVQVSDLDQGSHQLTLEITNRRAGHEVPTGDPERFLQLEVRALDATGTTVTLQTFKIGQTWLWNPARKINDNRLKWGQTLRWVASFEPVTLSHTTRIEVRVLHVRLTSKNAISMSQTPNVDASRWADAPDLVKAIGSHYPLARLVYSMTLNLESGSRRVATDKELIQLSIQENKTPLQVRSY